MHPGPYNPPPGAYPPPGPYGHNAPRYGHPGGGSRRGGCSCLKWYCCCCCCLFITIVLFLAAIVITLAIIKPQVPKYNIDDFAVKAFNITPEFSLKSHLVVTVKADNPNKYMEFEYGHAKQPTDNFVKVMYSNVELCSGAIPDFKQPKSNVTMMNIDLKGDLKKDDWAEGSAESLADKLKNNDKIDPFLLPSASAGFLLGDNDGRPGCSLEGRRVSCKRKAMEGNIGQSSVSGSCSYFQHTESGARPSVPAHHNAGSSINISAPSQDGNPRLGAGGRELTSDGLPDSNIGRSSESSHRNFRVRINPSNQQNSIPSTRFSTGRAARHSSGSSSQLTPALLPVDHSLDLRPAPVLDDISSQNQPVVVHVPALPQNVQSLRWNSGSSSRAGSLANSVFLGDRDAPPREEASSRSMARHILGHPIFVPATELRNSARLSAGSSSRNLTGGNASIPGNVASTSRTGPSSSAHPASAPTWVSHHNSHPQFPRRLSEYVRRSI